MNRNEIIELMLEVFQGHNWRSTDSDVMDRILKAQEEAGIIKEDNVNDNK